MPPNIVYYGFLNGNLTVVKWCGKFNLLAIHKCPPNIVHIVFFNGNLTIVKWYIVKCFDKNFCAPKLQFNK